MTDDDVQEGREVTVESGTVAMLAKSEIDTQIATAKKWPRSIKRFVDEATAMVTLNESIAQQCIYALVRRDASGSNVTIAGPSARFGEIVASAWGNCRAGARIVNEGAEFVTAQGVFHDLERNVAITYEVQRRITSSKGKRYGADMIGVTANAACSIALRNAILKGVPKAFWEPMYARARKVIAGELKTLGERRREAISQFAHFGVTEAQIVAKLGRAGVADIGLDDLVTLFGLLTAIKDGDTTPEQAFATDDTRPESSPPGEPPRKSNRPPPPADAPADNKPQPPGPPPSPGTEAEPLSEPAEAKSSPPPNPEPASFEPATEGERNWIIAKARGRRMALVDMLMETLEDARHINVETLEGLSKADYRLLKAKLS